MSKLEKAVLGIIGGILVSALAVAILRAFVGGMLASTFLSAGALKAVGLDKEAALRVPLMFSIYLPTLYAAGRYGPAARILAGTAAVLLLGLSDQGQGALFGASGWEAREALVPTLVGMGLGLTLVSCLSSWRKYLVAEFIGLLMAIRVAALEKGDAHAGVVIVLGLLFLGPILALGAGVLHVVEKWVAPEAAAQPQAQTTP